MRRKEILLILLLLLSLLPYFILCFLALPYADDFSYAWSSAEPVSFAARFMRQYMHCSGRYSAHVLLCLHPLMSGHLLYYHMADLFALTLVPAALIFFVSQFIHDRSVAFISSLVILLFYLCYIPQLSDGVYWYTGVCNYELSNVCFIVHLGLLMKLHNSGSRHRWMYILPASILLIASTGFNEVGAVLIPAYYFFALFIGYSRYEIPDAVRRMLRILFAMCFISFCILVLSPGNHVRSHYFPNHFQFLHSVLSGSLQTARFIGIWLCTIPALLFSLLVISYADLAPDTFITRLRPLYIIGLIFFSVFMSAFLPYYNTGILGQHRTINYVFFYFILLWLWLLISAGKKYNLRNNTIVSLIGKNSFTVIPVCILVMVCTANEGRILKDFSHGTFYAYHRDYMQRRDSLIAHPDMLSGPLTHVPQSLLIVDVRRDTSYWVNKALKIYTHRVELHDERSH